jgi:hypothetical protein
VELSRARQTKISQLKGEPQAHDEEARDEVHTIGSHERRQQQQGDGEPGHRRCGGGWVEENDGMEDGHVEWRPRNDEAAMTAKQVRHKAAHWGYLS